jgi:hypothetical protein
MREHEPIAHERAPILDRRPPAARCDLVLPPAYIVDCRRQQSNAILEIRARAIHFSHRSRSSIGSIRRWGPARAATRRLRVTGSFPARARREPIALRTETVLFRADG